MENTMENVLKKNSLFVHYIEQREDNCHKKEIELKNGNSKKLSLIPEEKPWKGCRFSR
jgi:hypothetical protein